MKITERRLRSIIRSIIRESDEVDHEGFQDIVDLVKSAGFKNIEKDFNTLGGDSTIVETLFRNKRLVNESLKVTDWETFLNKLEKRNVNLSERYHELDPETQKKVREQAEAIAYAKGAEKVRKTGEVLQILGISGVALSVLVTLIMVLSGGLVAPILPGVIASKLSVIFGGKSILAMFGIGTALASTGTSEVDRAKSMTSKSGMSTRINRDALDPNFISSDVDKYWER